MDQELTRRIEAVRGKRIFFIAATEKSGTTWLQIMLDAHPEAACRGEGQFATMLEPTLGKAFREYYDFIEGLNKKVFGETKGFPTFGQPALTHLVRTAALSLLAEYGADPAIKARRPRPRPPSRWKSRATPMRRHSASKWAKGLRPVSLRSLTGTWTRPVAVP